MKTLLVIEDDLALLDLLSGVLEDEGYRVVSANSGLRGLELAASVRPDLIITDLMMTGIDGLEFCRRLQADASIAAIPVVLCSARKEADIAEHCSYRAFIPKPFDIDHLLDIVARAS